MTSQNILKFDPKLGLEKHLTGESGCTNCFCKIIWSNSQLEKKWEWVHIIPDKEDQELDLDAVLNCSKIEPKKTQTIRRKPAKVGDKYEVWSMWSGMEKGFYCPECFTEACLTCKRDLQVYPKKLFDVEIIECEEIRFHWFDGIRSTRLIMTTSHTGFLKKEYITYDLSYHSFVKADMPNATNAQFIDFILRYNPKVKEEWTAMYLWKFRRIE